MQWYLYLSKVITKHLFIFVYIFNFFLQLLHMHVVDHSGKKKMLGVSCCDNKLCPIMKMN